MKVTVKNNVDYIIRYEQGDLSNEDVLELFSYLIKSGLAWNLQGHYGRTAKSFVEGGYLSLKGKILKSCCEEE
jgi:hypothetical protein